MKVLQINSVCGIGSTGRIATDIHNVLIEQGHESYIAYGRDLPLNCENAIRIGSRIDNYAHVAKTRIFDKHGFGSIQATKKFINKITILDPDIIHLHNIHGYYINIKILFSYLREVKKPVIWTLHDCWSFTGHCTHFDYIQCNRWNEGCYDCPQKNKYPSSVLMDNSTSNFKIKKDIFTSISNIKIVTPSEWLKSLVEDSYLNKYETIVINNGVDLEKFKYTKSEIKSKYEIQDKKVVLGVSNMWSEKQKGLNFMIELANRLDSQFKIVLIGVTKKLKKKIPDNIISITRTNNITELAEWYSAADVFVNPTLEDNYPTVNLEAIACGTPVVSFDTGGSKESALKYGVICKKGDIEGMVSIINKLTNNSITLNDDNINVTNSKEMATKYVALYESLFSNNSSVSEL